MPEYLAPGVYVEEVDTGDKPIEGVSTSTAGMVGVTERGHVGEALLVTSVADYNRQFGGRLDYHAYPGDLASGGISYLPLAVEGFFNNGGKRVYIVRVLPDSATYAQVQLFDRGDTTVEWSTTLNTAAVKNETFVLVAANNSIAADQWLVVEDGNASEYLQVSSGGPLSLLSPLLLDQPAGSAISGFDLAAGVSHQVAAPAPLAGDKKITVDVVAGFAVDQVILVGPASNRELVQIQAVDVPNRVLSLYTALTSGYALTDPVVVQTRTAHGGPATLAFESQPGDRLVVVDDASQAAGAQAVQIGVTPNVEWHFLGDMDLIQALNPIGFNHLAGAGVAKPTFADGGGGNRNITVAVAPGAKELQLANRQNLLAGQVLRLGNAAPFEYVIIATIPNPAATGIDPGPVELRAPVQGTYTVGSAGAIAHALNDAGAADANATNLMRSAHPGDSVLLIADQGANYAAGDVIRIEAFDSTLREYATLVAPTTFLVTLKGRLGASHSRGRVVAGRAVAATVQAIDRGGWGNDLQVTVDDDDPILDTAPLSFPTTGSGSLALTSIVGVEAGTILEFYTGTGATFQHGFYQKVDQVNTVTKSVTFLPPGLSNDVVAGMRVRTREFRITTACVRTNARTQKPQVVTGMLETLRQLSMDGRHSRYFVKVIGTIPAADDEVTDGESQLIRVADALSLAQSEADTSVRLGADNLAADPQQMSPLAARFHRQLGSGNDDVASIDDSTYEGTDSLDPVERRGLHALKNVEEISIVAIPGRVSQALQEKVIEHCELLRYRFAVLDSKDEQTLDHVQEQRNLFDTKYAAIYYPWLEIPDPFPANPRLPGEVGMPPSGHLMGIYARSDIERGVHKAPANEVVRAIDDLERRLLKEQQDILNPRNINVIRDFRDHGRGIRVWGARCITSDSDWKYVNVRRLFIYLEHSIDKGTQWVVFEPNDYRLWARVTQSVTAFLTSAWRDGMLMGKTPEQAFFVKCDITTMTQDDIDNGRLIMVIGVAPVKPAEFVIIRIGQWAGGSMVQEG